MHFSYVVVLFYRHFIWFYLTCLNIINGDGGGSKVPTMCSTVACMSSTTCNIGINETAFQLKTDDPQAGYTNTTFAPVTLTLTR